MASNSLSTEHAHRVRFCEALIDRDRSSGNPVFCLFRKGREKPLTTAGPAIDRHPLEGKWGIVRTRLH